MNITPYRTEQIRALPLSADRRSSNSFAAAATIALTALMLLASLVLHPPSARADVSNCTGSPENPIYPGYNSAELLDSYYNPRVGDIPIRRGFYCVPASSEGNLYLESQNGFGFGVDKVQNRHYIGRQNDGFTKAEAVKATKFVLSAPAANVSEKTDGFGPGFNFYVYARGGTECPEGGYVSQCANPTETLVKAAMTLYEGMYEPTGGMPVRESTSDQEPLGLQTVYCDYGDVAALRCEFWVTQALLQGAKKVGIS